MPASSPSPATLNQLLRDSDIAALAHLRLRPGERVADVGCGPGPHLAYLAAQVGATGHVTGIDIAPEALSNASANAANGALIEQQRLTLVAGDMAALPLADEALDAVWSSHMLHHCADQAAALRECARVLRPGGRIAVLEADLLASFPFLPWPPDLELRLRTALLRHAEHHPQDPERDPLHHFSARHLPRLLQTNGFARVKVYAVNEVHHAPFNDDDSQASLRWLRTYFTQRVVPHLSAADQTAFEAIVHAPDGSGLLAEPHAFITRTWFVVTGVRS